MRPPLHPEMGQSVICARVARQLTAQLFEVLEDFDHSPASAAYIAAANLPADYNGMLKFALHSLGVYLNLGWSSSRWLQSVLEASHEASNFRRCFFFDYKAERCSYPRVTNRGVQTSKKGRKSALRKA